MSYNFKNLADVELLSSMPEDASVVVEVNGTTKRAPQVDEMAKLAGVETLTEVPEGATVLAEVDGAIKRVPGAGLGGVASWNDLEDKPFDSELVCILPECQPGYDNGMNAFVINVSEDNLFLDGESYVVTINGIDYECTSFSAQEAIVLGNSGKVGIPGEEDNGLPFILSYMGNNEQTAQMGFNIALMFFDGTDGSTELTLAVYHQKVKTLDPKYLPDCGAIKTVILKDSNYDNMLTGVAAATADADMPTLSCVNMTYEEACEILLKGEPLNVVAMFYDGILGIVNGMVGFVPGQFIMFMFETMDLTLYWTPSGITMEMPEGEG